MMLSDEELAHRYAVARTELEARRAQAESRVVRRAYATGSLDDPTPFALEHRREGEPEDDAPQPRWLPDVVAPGGGLTEHGYDDRGRLVLRRTWNKVDPTFVDFETFWDWSDETVEITDYAVGTLDVLGVAQHDGTRIWRLQEFTTPHMIAQWEFTWHHGRCLRATYWQSGFEPRLLEAAYEGDALIAATFVRLPGRIEGGGVFRPARESRTEASFWMEDGPTEDPPQQLTHALREVRPAVLSWSVDRWQLSGDPIQRYDHFLAWISPAGPFPQVAHLAMHEHGHDHVRLGDLTALWPTFPHLRSLALCGELDRLGSITARRLEHLELRLRTTSEVVWHELAAADLRSLRGLELALASHGALDGLDALLDARWTDLAYVHLTVGDDDPLDRERLRILLAAFAHPSLRHFTLEVVGLDAGLVDLLVESVGRQPLHHLQLGLFRIDDDAVARLLHHRETFARLTHLTLCGATPTSAQRTQLAAAFAGFEARVDQRPHPPQALGLVAKRLTLLTPRPRGAPAGA